MIGAADRRLSFILFSCVGGAGLEWRTILKISFYQQTAEAEKQYAGKPQGAHSSHSVSGGAGYRVSIGAEKEDAWRGVPGGKEKGKSLIELQQEAGNIDAAVRQDYMTVMSNTMSEEDYAKLQEEGFHFESMDPEVAVNIVDKIKAELARSGKHIAGYTDDLDMDTLAAAVGSEALAAAVAQSFYQADVPLTEENLNDVVQAWNMAAELKPLGDGSVNYLIDNEMETEIWNLYLAQNSGAGAGGSSVPKYYAEDVQGYYTQSADVQGQEELSGQIDKIIESSGREVNEESRKAANWLLSQGLPLTQENLDRLDKIGELTLPVTEEEFAKAAAEAVAEGRNPIHGDLADSGKNLYEKASEIAEYYFNEEVWAAHAEDITARRQLEEIRLRMTAEVNVKLLKSGFSIDTAPMEELVEALKQAEAQLAREYFPDDAQAVEKYRFLQETNRVVAELPGLPAQVLGSFAEGQATAGLEEFHSQGKALQDTYEKANESYESLMTSPRSDLGDSIKKAFANVDDILRDLGLELTEENRRAARILGYNRMEMTVRNIETVREADRQVQTVVEKMTPGAVMKMIKDGVNPLEKSFEELEAYFDGLPEDYRDSSESYSRFLYGLEKNHAVTEEERAGYIGIYRLLRQIEKTDGAAVGALVNVQAQVQFANLLSAVRSNKVKTLDLKASDAFGAVERLVQKGESISNQIARAFVRDVEEILTEVSYSEEAAAEYNRESLEQIRQAAGADAETVAMLQRGEMPANADNLMAAQALANGTEDIFAPAGKKREDSQGIQGGLTEEDDEVVRSLKLWQSLDEKASFRETYAETVQEAVAAVETASFEEADNSVDVRRLQLIHKQLTVVSSLAEQEEYIVPMDIGGILSRVHLTFDRAGEKKGTVKIDVRMEDGEPLRAELSMENNTIHGIFTGKTQDEVMKLQKIADTFKEAASESWTVDGISIVTAEKTAAEKVKTDIGKDADRADNTELYRMAKVFLHAVKQGEETAYEN